jgi:hypothetical protein
MGPVGRRWRRCRLGRLVSCAHRVVRAYGDAGVVDVCARRCRVSAADGVAAGLLALTGPAPDDRFAVRMWDYARARLTLRHAQTSLPRWLFCAAATMRNGRA